ncbi:hypothetical protein SFRURICE_013427 [Spodoptera frugiperda]|nr:hypothetical protein SFRURICE_013427 [Spodoptera frugiperda]
MGVGSVRPTKFYFACSSVTMCATLLLFSIAGAVELSYASQSYMLVVPRPQWEIQEHKVKKGT